MATRMIGTIESYKNGQDFKAYAERMEQFFIVNEIEEEKKKVGLLITLIGPETYEILKNLVSPAVPSSKGYSELVKLLSGHFVEKKSAIAARYEFYHYRQLESQSVNDYVIELKKKAGPCEFKTFLNEALRDKFVCGLKSEQTIRRLLAEDDLSFESAVKLACAFEGAERETRNMQPQSIQGINYKNKIDQKGGKTDSKKGWTNYRQIKEDCQCCGGAHATEKCFKKSWTSNKCRFRRGTYQRNIHNLKKEKEEENENSMQEEEIILGSINTVKMSIFLP
ncbi:hypothetical protein ABMA27_014697 [Loxostege sticticalis]|uniref:Retrotransposon gag domain-containing protein n=1 Tax=Loxostege sticticalis TaxID=481309 RepID=A0ABR3I9V3_LOXSC